MKPAAWLIFLLTAVLPVLGANTTAKLLLADEIAKPGQTVWAGVQLRMKPGWHTYWRNGGDSGAPTTIEWTLPAGVTAGEIHWPPPEVYETAGLVTYVYHDEVVLLVPLAVAGTVQPGPLELKAKVAWLECEKLCVAENAKVSASMSIGAEAKPSKDAALIAEWRKKLSGSKPADFASAWWSGPVKDDVRPVFIEWTTGKETKGVDFYPYAAGPFAVKAVTERVVDATPGKVRLKKEVEKLEAWPEQISGLLIERDANAKLISAFEVTLPIGLDRAASKGSSGTDRGSAAGIEQKPLIAWLGFAFLGGLILNLMPCVLPVIALKVFGFVAQSHESPARARQLGLIYGLGVVFSFLVLAGLVIGVQSAGRAASWGMQYGNPYFLVSMTALVTLVALNFFGLFEVTLGGGAMGAASALAAREGTGGAFFNGVLTTVLATPCTAPFLASALGFAFAQPATVIVLVFVTIALGLAAPYVVLSFQPGWVRFLPKPGPWMEKFRTAMGFPMLATALYLLSVLDAHYGDEGVLWVGVFLVCVAAAAWTWGSFVQRGAKRKGLAMALAGLFLVGGYLLALESALDWRHRGPSSAGSTAGRPGEIVWEPWSQAAVDRARAEGRPVLVDFTARWCPNCRVNKKTSIEVPSVRQKLREINAMTLKGDYTHFPDDITAELKRFQRAGVPLDLVYPKDPSMPPIVLPELLTPSIVLEALEKATK